MDIEGIMMPRAEVLAGWLLVFCLAPALRAQAKPGNEAEAPPPDLLVSADGRRVVAFETYPGQPRIHVYAGDRHQRVITVPQFVDHALCRCEDWPKHWWSEARPSLAEPDRLELRRGDELYVIDLATGKRLYPPPGRTPGLAPTPPDPDVASAGPPDLLMSQDRRVVMRFGGAPDHLLWVYSGGRLVGCPDTRWLLDPARSRPRCACTGSCEHDPRRELQPMMQGHDLFLRRRSAQLIMISGRTGKLQEVDLGLLLAHAVKLELLTVPPRGEPIPVPVHEQLATALGALEASQPRVGPPAGWDFTVRLRFLLPDGTPVEGHSQLRDDGALGEFLSVQAPAGVPGGGERQVSEELRRALLPWTRQLPR